MANIENLRRAVEHLKTIDESMFDMNFFVGVKTEMCINVLHHISKLNLKEAECGTVGCVIGHCAVLDKEHFGNILKHNDMIIPEDYAVWSSEFFEVEDEEWEWLFGGDWAKYDNTIAGAIDRIELYIKEEKTPDEFYEANFSVDEYFKKHGNNYSNQ